MFDAFLDARNAVQIAILTARQDIASEDGEASTKHALDRVGLAARLWEDVKKAISSGDESEGGGTFVAVWDAQIQDLQSTIEQLQAFVSMKAAAQSLGVEVTRAAQSAMLMNIRVFAGSLTAWSHNAKAGHQPISVDGVRLLDEIHEKVQQLVSILEQEGGQSGIEASPLSSSRRKIRIQLERGWILSERQWK